MSHGGISTVSFPWYNLTLGLGDLFQYFTFSGNLTETLTGPIAVRDYLLHRYNYVWNHFGRECVREGHIIFDGFPCCMDLPEDQKCCFPHEFPYMVFSGDCVNHNYTYDRSHPFFKHCFKYDSNN